MREPGYDPPEESFVIGTICLDVAEAIVRLSFQYQVTCIFRDVWQGEQAQCFLDLCDVNSAVLVVQCYRAMKMSPALMKP